jgi:hypothetical protein
MLTRKDGHASYGRDFRPNRCLPISPLISLGTLPNSTTHLNQPISIQTPLPSLETSQSYSLAHLLFAFTTHTTLSMSSSSPTSSSSSSDSEPPPFEVRFPPRGKNKRPKLDFKHDLLLALAEFLGTAIFLFLALGGTNFARLPLLPLLPLNSLPLAPSSIPSH